ncbi:MAG: S24/S26 family peptidase [Ruminococcus sp.]|nr:S24/S26 family peptidase [Ruminococcus sp.]
MNNHNIEKYFEENELLTYRNVGVSMLPLLKEGRDVFTVRKKSSRRCKKNDVVLYRRSKSTYVLHRVIKVRENDYVIMGDNCTTTETGVTDDDIVAVMVSFIHKGKRYNVTDLRYRIYSALVSKRYILILLKKKIRRVLRRLWG